MRVDHVEDDILQRYFDGELSGKRCEGVQEHLESCELCQKRQESLSKLHELFAQNAEELARDVNFDLLYRRVASEIARQKPAGLLEKLRAWWEGLNAWQPRVWAPATAVALAAVALVVFTRPREPELLESANGKQTPQSMVAATSSSEIVRVDFGDKAGTVFEVALAEGITTAVIWINDDIENLGIQ
jgi:anti-sigma factor RsiW